MDLHEQICFLKDKTIKVNPAERTNRKTEEEKCAEDFYKWYFSQRLELVSYFWQSDWISSITEIACQSTDRKAFFFSFPCALCR